MTGEEDSVVTAAAQKCHRAALATSDELAERNSRKSIVECQAFTRDGGGTHIGVFAPQ